jgi:hypothetical protein
MASKHTARNLLAAAFSSVGSDDFGDARGFLERADREVKRLREEGCDDIDAPKKTVRRILGTPLGAWRKRKESKKDTACDAPERSRSMLKFARKALVLLALPVAGALSVQHYDKIAGLMPDFGTATRSEFLLADACLGCNAITEKTDEARAFCVTCGTSEVKEVVAAKLTSGWSLIGWQLPDGQTVLLDEDAEIEVPPLRVKGSTTKSF